LRLGRLPLVALEATLASYLEGQGAEVPVVRALRMPIEAVRERVEAWCARLAAAGVQAEPKRVAAVTGGGALADRPLPSMAAALATDDPMGLAARLRMGTVGVIARIQDDQVLLDGRTVLPDEDDELVAAVIAAVAAPTAPVD
jgi:L-seryl-tRNA(Ser) seleniumtransferase